MSHCRKKNLLRTYYDHPQTIWTRTENTFHGFLASPFIESQGASITEVEPRRETARKKRTERMRQGIKTVPGRRERGNGETTETLIGCGRVVLARASLSRSLLVYTIEEVLDTGAARSQFALGERITRNLCESGYIPPLSSPLPPRRRNATARYG